MSEKMKNILVVGGAGYIGGLTTDILLEKGYNVTVYDNLMYETRFLKPCSFIYGDIRDTEKLLSLEREYDEIIWLAAIVGDEACEQDEELTREINVNSLRRFLEKTKRKVVFASTCSVYGATKDIVNEEGPTNPLSLYAVTKLEAEKYVMENGGSVFRLGTVYGLGDVHSRIRLDLVVNILTLKAVRDGKLTIFGGDQYRPIIAVRDVANYLTEAVTRDYNDIFVVKYRNIRILELAELIKTILPSAEMEVTDREFEDLRSYRVDSSKVEKYFTFKPETSIEAEIIKMKNIFEEHRIRNVNDAIYHNANYVKALLDNSMFSKGSK
ncbi:NAD-dependent epimerase/dehydratase family protein [Chloroflexota bacterium]